ncbi:uncharacterized protein LOC135345414 [Halichondria panicea]|uniref:uncharacterized protein LOC135345414 n=1 Tax=Halichondria panicea TaxID=6063 RepID=UPI00312B5EC1
MADSKLSITLNDLSAVYEATFQARAKWKQMLLALQVNNTTIETINIRCREDPDNCYLEGLSEWLKGGERNWTDVFEALSRSSVGHNDLAKVVEKRLTKPTGNTEYRLSSSSLQLATNGSDSGIMEMTNINSVKQRSSIEPTKDHTSQADTNHGEISSTGDQSLVTTHSRRCKWSWLLTIIILLVVIVVLTVVVLAVLLPVLKLELSHSDTSTPPTTGTTGFEETTFSTTDMNTTVLPASPLNINVNSIYQLPEMSAIFVSSFIKSTHDSISFSVIEKNRISRGFLIDFTVNDCQELDVDRVAVNKPISLSITRPIQHVDEGYYLNGSILTYSITPSQAIVSSSCDCPVILVIYDDQEIYTEFLNEKTGVQTGFLFKCCLNRSRLSAKIVLNKNSYLYAAWSGDLYYYCTYYHQSTHLWNFSPI